MPITENRLEIDVLTEAFYYNASERSIKKAIPGLSGFEAPGVRDVRCHLVEHPEGKDSTIVETGDAFSTEVGPIIKYQRRPGAEHIFPDKGLYVNAEEFRARLEALLQRKLVAR